LLELLDDAARHDSTRGIHGRLPSEVNGRSGDDTVGEADRLGEFGGIDDSA
jgi:hypothetical protein